MTPENAISQRQTFYRMLDHNLIRGTKALGCRAPSCAVHGLHCIVPPYMLEKLSQSSNVKVRTQAIAAIEASAEGRAVRRTLNGLAGLHHGIAATGKKNRLIYDAKGLSQIQLPGRLVRSEGSAKTSDAAVNEAYDHSGITYDFYSKIFTRNSLDDKGMALISSVHLLKNYNNAFWNGQQMAYGDGDGIIFQRFTRSLDVVGHELTHGVISNECNLIYQGQSGALNEHFADTFGLLIKQWSKKQTAAKADWLVGAEVMTPQSGVRALRTFKAELAYENNPNLGTDPQPKHMRDFYKGSDDNGGVHINSGIPNHAFYLFATAVGKNAWQTCGAVWYEAMRKLSSNSQFADMVTTTGMIAINNHGKGSPEHKALLGAWKAVGL
jgi:Zn-dependent metalloprotease